MILKPTTILLVTYLGISFVGQTTSWVLPIGANTTISKPSPVDCELGQWNDCSTTCGTGMRSRNIVQEALHGGKECSTNRTIACNLDKPCPEEKTGDISTTTTRIPTTTTTTNTTKTKTATTTPNSTAPQAKVYRTCTSSEFDCKAAGCTNPDNEKCIGTCIPKSWVNDGEEECADGSDEGIIVTCDAPQHCCQNGDQGCEGKCIPERWIDDGEKDCDDGSDEKDTEIPKFLRNLTLTTQSDDYCGGYNVWIEIEVNGKKCTTKEIPEFDRGNTLLWFGKYLSSCRDFEFGEDLELINFKVKSNSNDKYCPRFLYAFMEGGITFKSDEMAHEFGDWYSRSKTNYRNHIARRTGGTFELPKSAIKTPGQGEIFDKKQEEIKKLLQVYKGSKSLDKFLKGLVPITHNSIFNPSDITEKSCKQFDLLLDDWVKNVDIVYKENKENPPNKSTLSLIELIDFTWKLKRLINVESDEYQEWTATVRATAYGTATGVSIGMVIADVFGCLGICSAAVTSSTWAATLATVESTIATSTLELSGLDALANGLTGKMMDHYCADF